MEAIIATILIVTTVIFTTCHLLFRYAPREWIFKVKEPITIHHKKHKNGAFTFPPFHYLNKNGTTLKLLYIGSFLTGITTLIIASTTLK